MPIRVRLALVCSLVAALLVAAGGVLFTRELTAQLLTSLDTDLRSRAEAVAVALQAGAQPSFETGRVTGPQDVFVQVLSDSDRVVAGSSAVARTPLLSTAELERLGTDPAPFQRRINDDSENQDTVHLMAMRAATPEGALLVVAGGSDDPIEDAAGVAVRELVIGGTAVVLLTGLGAWLLAGAALRPVERMRRQVSLISDRDQEARLQIPRTQDELAALAVTMNGLVERLQAALAHERRLVADAAHELRMPLAILRAELDLAARPGRTRAQLVQAVATAASETDRLVHLSEDLLFLARMDDGVPALRTEPQALGAVLQPSVDAHAPRAAARGVRCDLEVAEGLTVVVDEARVRRAVDNLLDNALRVAPAGTSVLVAAVTEGPMVTVSVSDRGPGFPDDFLPHAFARFRRADEARSREEGGTGLGLAIVQAIAEAHGGVAAAENRAGGGATVRFSIPLGQPSPLEAPGARGRACEALTSTM